MPKLVRDKIPDMIRAQGSEPRFHVARPEEYFDALLDKLQEETAEFLDSRTEADLVDVLEVMDAIVHVMDEGRVAWMRQEKAALKGTFSKRIVLDDDAPL